MTNGEILSPQTASNIKFHGNNKNKNIIFSSCLMAKNDVICEELKINLHAKRVFAYKHLMRDRFCFLNEAILLTQIEKVESTRKFSGKDFEEFQENTLFMKNLNQKHVKSHPMKMYG